MKVRKGDLPKIILLVVLIVGVFVFMFRVIMPSGAKPTPAQTAAGPAPNTTNPAPTLENGTLFAPREHTTSELLVRAHAAPDPFKPDVVAEVVHSVTPAPAKPSTPPFRAATLLPTTPEEPTLRLVGLVSGAYPMAILAGDGQRHYVRAGDTLPSGWRVTQLNARNVVVVKGKTRHTLTLTRETPAAVPPLGAK